MCISANNSKCAFDVFIDCWYILEVLYLYVLSHIYIFMLVLPCYLGLSLEKVIIFFNDRVILILSERWHWIYQTRFLHKSKVFFTVIVLQPSDEINLISSSFYCHIPDPRLKSNIVISQPEKHRTHNQFFDQTPNTHTHNHISYMENRYLSLVTRARAKRWWWLCRWLIIRSFLDHVLMRIWMFCLPPLGTTNTNTPLFSQITISFDIYANTRCM